jgi:Wzt C-terminal domain
MPLVGVFPGRVIFDHLPKTAGQAINAWLAGELGSGCVTPNLIGSHRDLIRRYGGVYSVMSGHVHFNGEGLDPRYQYATLFREPIDRALSFIFFALTDVVIARDAVPLAEGAKRFLESDGRDTTPEFLNAITNPYTEHFRRISGTGRESDDEKIEKCLDVIRGYAVVGLYENMPRFLANFANLIGMPPPAEIARVNVTRQRGEVDKISAALRQRVIELNELDLRLYARVSTWSRQVEREAPRRLTTLRKWQKYEPVLDRVVNSTDLTVIAASLREGTDVCHGQLLTFDVDFCLARDVHGLEAGIHIFDGNRGWAFGINNTLLGHTPQVVRRGSYRVSYHVIADLPVGKYTAGFAFAERLTHRTEELAWRDVMCEFQVRREVDQIYAGSCYLPAEISLNRISSAMSRQMQRHRFQGDDDRIFNEVGLRLGNDVVCNGQEGYLIFGPYISLTAGRYRLKLRGMLNDGRLAGAHMDVVSEKGTRVIAKCQLGEPDEEGCFVELPMSLDSACTDLEVRVWVSDGTDLRISMIEIEPSDEVELLD